MFSMQSASSRPDDVSHICSQNEPIIIQGNGRITLFGLNNHFSTALPNRLRTRLAPEEFELTILLINRILRRKMLINLFWFFFGCGTFCCTLGCSMWPAIYFNRKTIRKLKMTLKSENNRLYNTLGMQWCLQKHKVGPLELVEYYIVISFLQKEEIFVPD